MEATSNPIVLLTAASLLSAVVSGVEISPKEVYCDIHENHTLCIHQASQSLVKSASSRRSHLVQLNEYY